MHDPCNRALPMAYGTILMSLALRKAATIWKEQAGLKGLGLVRVLIRDQAIYFLVCASIPILILHSINTGIISDVFSTVTCIKSIDTVETITLSTIVISVQTSTT